MSDRVPMKVEAVRVLSAYELSRAGDEQPDLIDWVNRELHREVRAHPDYAEMQDQVNRRGHVLRYDMREEVSPDFGGKRLIVTVRDGGPPAPSD